MSHLVCCGTCLSSSQHCFGESIDCAHDLVCERTVKRFHGSSINAERVHRFIHFCVWCVSWDYSFMCFEFHDLRFDWCEWFHSAIDWACPTCRLATAVTLSTHTSISRTCTYTRTHHINACMCPLSEATHEAIR